MFGGDARVIQVSGSGTVETVTPEELRELGSALSCQTQTDLAKALGVTQGRISQILSGRHPVRPGALLTLIRQLQAQTTRKKVSG
jgi:plasmid maintenance system antidote protein VapI